MIHCPLIRHSTIKEKAPETQGTTNHTHKYSTESPSILFLSRIFLPYKLKHRRRFGWRHTGVLLFHPIHFASFPSIETTPFIESSIRYDEKLNYWFFALSYIMYMLYMVSNRIFVFAIYGNNFRFNLNSAEIISAFST